MSDAAGWILLAGRILFPAIFLNSVPFHSVQGQMANGQTASPSGEQQKNGGVK
jgi:hypothetical protein